MAEPGTIENRKSGFFSAGRIATIEFSLILKYLAAGCFRTNAC